MAIKYEYSSQCCNHYYIETRNDNDAQVMTKCNICGQGEYVKTRQIEIETIPQPVYQASEDQIVSVRDRLISAGFTEEEIEDIIKSVKEEQ